MTYQTEFPDFDGATLPEIPAGFDDASWHNNACPSFRNEALSLEIFIDYADPAMREMGPDMVRYSVQYWPHDSLDSPVDVAHGNDWAAILDAIELRRLAADAIPHNDDEWGSDRQIAAENAFARAAEKRMTNAQWDRLEAYWLKANTEEAVAYALSLVEGEGLAMDARTALAEVIAFQFARELKASLRPDQWDEMRRRNATADYDGGCCASHDFCDANMVMHPAFVAVTGRDPLDHPEGSAISEEDCELWNAAWNIAKRVYLTA